MSRFKKSRLSKIVSVTLGLTTAVMMFGGVLVTPASAATVEELQAQIATLLAQIQALQSQMSGISGGSVATGTVCGFTFGANLKQGDTGSDAMNLQKVLNSDQATQVASSGVGSTGNESSYFGSLTKSAVIKFQNKYASDVLTPVGLTTGTGYVGPSTRAKLNALFGTCAPTTPPTTGEDTTPPPTSVGTGLTVSSVAQPTASLAVESAARLPFTKVALTASADGDVTVNSILVERTGLAQDAVFAGIVLLDENGNQIGIAKTLNSVHQATVGDPFVVKAGQTRTVTIAGNMLASLDSYAGQVAFLSVVKVNTSANVSGALPITGAGHTININLAIGSATPAVGGLDPNASASKPIGTTGYTFASVKVTSGSAEKIRLNSIRWNQSGSVGSTDLENLKTYVDGTAYDVVASSNGQYYTTNFGSGIVIDKGSSKEVSIKGDIAGGSGRTIIFDIYKNTDINVTGETFGYGITPSGETTATAADTSSQFTTGTPWFDGSKVTVSAGTLNVQKATTVEAQNIAENVTDQPLGGFLVEAKGEEISAASLVFHFTIATTSGSAQSVADVTNITLVDENGSIVAGPADGATVGLSGGTVTFSDTVTFPIGKHLYQLKGKIGTDFANNDTIQASTTPSTDWTTVTGQVTGNSITPSPTSAVVANTMTVKASSLTISVSPDPAAQTVVAGGTFTFANYYFDTTASGEDIKMSTLPLAYGVSGDGSATNLTSCALYDGASQITTGSNVVNPSAAGSSTSFTIDGSGLVIPKGTVKTVSLKCDIAGNATGMYLWGIDSAATFAGTGLTSNQSVTPTATDANGQLITLASSGSFTVALDTGKSPSSKAAAVAGSTGNTVGVLKFHATNEAIDITRVALQITSASTSRNDIVRVTLHDYDSGAQVGEAFFTTANNATSTLTSAFRIPKDSDKYMTVKADLATIGTTGLGTQGHLVTVDYDGTDSTGTRGTGVNSGSTINTGSTADSAVNGLRMFKSLPTVAKVSVPTNSLSNGTKTLLRFKVTADSAGDVGLYKFTVQVSTTTAVVTNLNAYGYTDAAFSNPVSGVNAGGKLMNSDKASFANNADINVVMDNAGTATNIQIPAGQTRYFEVTATVASSAAGASVSTQLQGDAAYPQLLSYMGDVTLVDDDAGSNDDFIWSPNATTTSANAHADWINGYNVIGLPGANLTAEVLSQ
ncbi:MAG: peptidoglycan-binding protein [Parcubacteria group bacterium]|nr:peptidoglycan-binding protein [Parcubacteria group bacterium]MCR4342495.1 peptidoglycan-binding protein [Patescibacteria group bacterium]